MFSHVAFVWYCIYRFCKLEKLLVVFHVRQGYLIVVANTLGLVHLIARDKNCRYDKIGWNATSWTATFSKNWPCAKRCRNKNKWLRRVGLWQGQLEMNAEVHGKQCHANAIMRKNSITALFLNRTELNGYCIANKSSCNTIVLVIIYKTVLQFTHINNNFVVYKSSSNWLNKWLNQNRQISVIRLFVINATHEFRIEGQILNWKRFFQN